MICLFFYPVSCYWHHLRVANGLLAGVYVYIDRFVFVIITLANVTGNLDFRLTSSACTLEVSVGNF